VNQEYDISIITVNYNGIKDTMELIDSIPFDEYSLEVIVVDNASSQDEASIIENKYPKVKVLRSKINLGFAGGNNLGIKAAKAKYIFFVNNDTYFKDFNINALILRLQSSTDIGVACPKIRFSDNGQHIQYAGYTKLSGITIRNKSIGYDEPDNGQYNIAHPTYYAHGAAMMVKREVIEHIGMMPEEFFLYYEEIDWSIRIRNAGYKIWYEPACTIFHKESKSTGRNSPTRAYYLTHNRFLLVKRNYKGINKFISYLYLIIASSTDSLLNLIRGHNDLSKSIMSGIITFLKIGS